MIQSNEIPLDWSQIQDMGAENVYIYTASYSLVKQFHTKSDVFFSPKMTMITFLYESVIFS